MTAEWNLQSFTYKSVGDCHIQADVYHVANGEKQPIVLWIHGGALICGGRSGMAPYQLERYLSAGFTVISIDYRLAPETKLPSIIEDLQDAFRWVRGEAPALFAIDPDRIAVVGHSAGGYLAQMAGFCVNPPPKAIVSFYGYGDIIGPWYSQADPYYSSQGMIPLDKATESVGVLPVSNGDCDNRILFYFYCRQHGLWPQEVAGKNPHSDPDWFSRYCPLQNVTGRYPPTLLVHGDQDTDVPYEQSVMMDGVLETHQVDHQLLTLVGRGHVFDYASDAQTDPVIVEVFDQVEQFLKRHCK